MKQIYSVKKLLIVALLCVVSATNAQITHPNAFGIVNVFGNPSANTNWYKDYVGLRFAVTSPTVISGDKDYSYAYSGGTPWGGQVTTPIVNCPIFMDTTSDSFGCSPFSPADIATIAATPGGKIVVLWRGPMGTGACEFGQKAKNAELAGARAVVIINEYPGQGPIGMAAGTVGGTVTIPVFMVGNLDGIAIAAQYRSGAPVKFTITPWGIGGTKDLGFVPAGVAGWHAYAVPSTQLISSGSPWAYMGLDGAFIANYGTHDATNTRLAATLSFTPDGSTTEAAVHTDTTANLAMFHQTDSIYAMFAPNTYNFAATGKGRFDLKYQILTDSVDDNPLDNTSTYTFYASDSVYSKGRYDFAAQGPISTTWQAPGGTPTPDYVWGAMYYVANGGAAISKVQFSLYGSALGPITSGPMNVYVFKWVDGGAGQPVDSIVENGELTLVSQGVYSFNGTTDTSGMVFTTKMGNPGTGAIGAPILLQSNTWYYVAAEASAGNFFGCDGILSPLPRIYGRAYNSNSMLEYNGIMWPGDYNLGSTLMIDNPGAATAPCPFAGTAYLTSIDSFNYNTEKGLIPSVAMIVKNTPDTTVIDHTGVNPMEKPFVDVDLSPNPASNFINVDVKI